MTNILLANLVYIFHICVILFVLFAPFINVPGILILHITFCLSLMVHWLCNSNTCSLTLIESYLRNTNTTETFTHAFISPLYDINTSEWDKIVWSITIISLCISLYNLIYNPSFIIVLEKLKIVNSYQEFFTEIHPLFDLE